MKTIKEEIISYWNDRSEDFVRLHLKELRNDISLRWECEIERYLPDFSGHKLHVLDVGCGSGFFALLLERKGYHVTGIDLSEGMVAEAKKAAKIIGAEASFFQMDAEALRFPDSTFDLVIARNLTWTMPDLSKAYSEWLRVLRPGGILLNFDADYRSYIVRDDLHKDVTGEQLKRHADIVRGLGKRKARPKWDEEILSSFSNISVMVDETVSSRIYIRPDIFYNPVPMFLIAVKKED